MINLNPEISYLLTEIENGIEKIKQKVLLALRNSEALLLVYAMITKGVINSEQKDIFLLCVGYYLSIPK